MVVENTGEAGAVQVTITVFDEDDTVVGKQSRTVSMDAGEERHVTIEMDVPADAERFEATAASA